MITGELIKQQTPKTPFTDDQIELIEQLSKNDEDVTIGNKTRQWYSELDALIAEQTGVQKDGREKASDYAKRAFAALKSENQELATFKIKAQNLEAEIATLKDGKVDAATNQKIHDLNAELKSLKETHQAQLQEKETALTAKEQALLDERFETELASALLGVTFKKDETATALKDITINAAKQALRSEYTLDVVDGVRVLRDKEGEIVRNPKNGNAPATLADFLLPKIAPIVDQGRQAVGTGTKDAKGNVIPQSNFTSTAKTRTDFDRDAGDHLMKQGIERGTTAFTEKLTELRKEFNVSALPEA